MAEQWIEAVNPIPKSCTLLLLGLSLNRTDKFSIVGGIYEEIVFHDKDDLHLLPSKDFGKCFGIKNALQRKWRQA